MISPSAHLRAGRHAGLLIPLFSMPSRQSWGIGEIGDIPLMAAWLRGAHQDLLQLLPINEMAVGQRSPYSAMTAMAIDPIFISVHAVEEFRAIGGEAGMTPDWRDRLMAARRAPAIDHATVRSVKAEALRAAFARFKREHWAPASSRAAALRAWSEDQSWWLSDYALYRALRAADRDRPWLEWPTALRDREPGALALARRDLRDEILYRQWLQWIADTQWCEAKELARPVSLMGDLPFMVDGDSADVWANAEAFRLDASVGAPPDAFSVTGQNWGMPAYRWDVMQRQDYRWLRERARRSAAIFDGYRVDHLVGFYRTYQFPLDGSPAHFSPALEDEQLRLGETVLTIFAEPGARIIAEDLGTVPDFVRASLARLDVPGYKVFRWERHWSKDGQPYRDPAAYPASSVATSGTHDTEPTAAWWDGLDDVERRKVLEAPGVAERLAAAGGRDARPTQSSQDTGSTQAFTPALRDIFLEVLFASGSDFLLLPIQDVFGWRDRINVPGSQGDRNWTWRLPWPIDDLASQPDARERCRALRAWTERCSRQITAFGAPDRKL
jgi:4-alpha-glucanotransferase